MLHFLSLRQSSLIPLWLNTEIWAGAMDLQQRAVLLCCLTVIKRRRGSSRLHHPDQAYCWRRGGLDGGMGIGGSCSVSEPGEEWCRSAAKGRLALLVGTDIMCTCACACLRGCKRYSCSLQTAGHMFPHLQPVCACVCVSMYAICTIRAHVCIFAGFIPLDLKLWPLSTLSSDLL